MSDGERREHLMEVRRSLEELEVWEDIEQCETGSPLFSQTLTGKLAL